MGAGNHRLLLGHLVAALDHNLKKEGGGGGCVGVGGNKGREGRMTIDYECCMEENGKLYKDEIEKM